MTNKDGNTSMSNRFRNQLMRQVSFLENSCDLFDKGQWEEAIRIATSIRVIVHDTKNSISLLKHLNAKTLNIFTTYVEPPAAKENGCISIHGFSMGILSIDNNGQNGYGPDLEDFEHNVSHVLPIDQWWTQVVWVLESQLSLTRKDIILTAANQDGGAHVDEKLNESYKKLAEETWGHLHLRKGSTCVISPIINMHLVVIRTIANELLKSPEFLNLLVN